MSDFASIAAATSGTTDDEASKKFGSTAGATFSFGTATFAAPAATAAAAAGGEDDEEGGDDNANPEAEESTAVFTPLVHLEQIEVKTMEEDEDILFKRRGKLFTYSESLLNKGTGTKTWNERGVGEVKLLKHKETNHIRVLMRQDKTMKVICNHVLDPRIVLAPNAGCTDRSWVWTAFDFAEGVLEEKTFALKFGDVEGAKEFETGFKAGQKEMEAVLAGLDAAEGSKEADEAAEAVAALAVKEDKKEGEAEKTEG